MRTLQFLVLGPLMVRDDGGQTLTLGAPKVAALLALLLVRRGEAVPVDEIAQTLWPGSAQAKQASALRYQIWKLRSSLEPGRPRGIVGGIVPRETGGYRLDLTHHSLDIACFEADLEAARDAIRSAPERALEHTRQGLARWRGDPFADVQYEDFVQGEIRRAHAMRLDLHQLRIDSLLQLERASEAIIDLEGLTASNPLVERLWAQLMAALFLNGRSSEAQLAYRRATAALAADGLEPSAFLRELERELHAAPRNDSRLLELLGT